MKEVKGFKCKSWIDRMKFRNTVRNISVDELEQLIDIHKEKEFNILGFSNVISLFKESENCCIKNEKQLLETICKMFKYNFTSFRQARRSVKREKIILRNLKRRKRKSPDSKLDELERKCKENINDCLSDEAAKSDEYVEAAAEAVNEMILKGVSDYVNNPTKETAKKANSEINKIFRKVLNGKKEKSLFYYILIVSMGEYAKEFGFELLDFISVFFLSDEEVVLS